MKSLPLALLVLSTVTAITACAASVNRSLCEGFKVRMRVVEPLADQKRELDTVSCKAYEAERDRLVQQRPQ